MNAINRAREESQDTGSLWDDISILSVVAAIVFIAALAGIYGADVSALARGVL